MNHKNIKNLDYLIVLCPEINPKDKEKILNELNI